jgi:hypothetical protein
MYLKKLIMAAALTLFCHAALADNIDAETKAGVDLTEDGRDAQTANYAHICQLRDFNWVSAVNSMVLERAARDTEALKRAGDTSDDIRHQWEIIARGMTLYWNPATINCDRIGSDLSNLDALATRGGYSNNP